MAVLFSWHKALSFAFQLPLKQTMRLPWHNANFSALHSILRLWLCRFRARGHFFGLKATFPGTRPLLRAQGHFYGHKATFTGPRPPFWAQSHFPKHYIAFLGYDYAVSWHKAIFLALPMLFTDAMPSFWVPKQAFLFGLKATGTWPFSFISITNANYGLNAAWHKAFFFS